MTRSKHSTIFYIIAGAVAIIFVVDAIRKLIGVGSEVEDFESWGYAPAFMYLIGVVELLGAATLLIPKTRIPAITGLGVVMLGAIGTHLFNGEYYRMLLPLALLLLLISLIGMSRNEIEEANMKEHDKVNY